MNAPTDEANDSTLPTFTAVQARILASLMEKQLTTPNNYPLSMNSLLLACNQKSNRVPVMNLTEGELGHAVNQLEQDNYLGVDYGGRANHVTHRVMTAFAIDRKQQAILAVLMVREPLTLNDIKSKTGRMEHFTDLNDLNVTLQSLLERAEPLVIRIPKGPGSREDRYTHLLCGAVDVSTVVSEVKATPTSAPSKLTELEQRVAQLEAQMAALMAHNEN